MLGGRQWKVRRTSVSPEPGLALPAGLAYPIISGYSPYLRAVFFTWLHIMSRRRVAQEVQFFFFDFFVSRRARSPAKSSVISLTPHSSMKGGFGRSPHYQQRRAEPSAEFAVITDHVPVVIVMPSDRRFRFN